MSAQFSLRLFLPVPLVVLLVMGCKGSPKAASAIGGPVIASVDGDKLTKDELDSLSSGDVEITPDNLPAVLDKWVSNTLMYQSAVKRGIAKEPKVSLALKQLERTYLANELRDRWTSSIKVGKDQEMQYFNQHKDDFSSDVKISRIVMGDSLMAAQTLSELKAGADFTKLAKERSQDPVLPAGQESPFVGRADIGDPEMADAIYSLSLGQVSDVLPSPEGYQIIRLVDKKKTRADVSFAEASTYIEAVLKYRRGQAVLDSELAALREKAKIELKPDAYFQPEGK